MKNNLENKIPLISVVGPTASGKTRLGVTLAKHFGGEVISADSMQIYKSMDIATAKPTEEEMCGIPHHLIGFLQPDKTFSVAQFTELAKAEIEDIHARGKLPVVVGGTGLYVNSLLNNISFSENDSDEKLRAELRDKADKQGVMSLIEELREFDPESADRIEPNNVKRVIRAIEVYRTTGITMTEQNRLSRLAESPYRAVKIGLKAHDRQYLYDRINRRVDIMVEQGLLDEAEKVLANGCGQTAEKAIGYKELIPYFNGEASLESALEELKKQSRRYAKRQLTWFLRDKEIHWFDIDTFESVEALERQAVDYADKELNRV
ncbi:MAG: tRNA (adenosine(37)-N6)-dimethylallyltransferase MiaA [Clostridia bacterium]|nr:tRNA (adenosine(37)-N6)-dimethylallyltransferase MiaA [Clostridia bacterium]